MLCTEILDNVADRMDADDPAIDRLPLMWQQCLQRAFRARTLGGRELRICVPPGKLLRHGDVLVREESVIVAVEALAGEMLVVRLRDPAEMLRAAYLLGDEHLPVEIADGALVTPADALAAELLRRNGWIGRSEVRRFTPMVTATLAGPGVGSDFAVKRDA